MDGQPPGPCLALVLYTSQTKISLIFPGFNMQCAMCEEENRHRRCMLLTMGIVQRPLDIIHCRIWHPTSFENLQPFLGGFCLGHLFDHSVDIRSTLYSVTVCDETPVCFPLGETQSIAKHSKKPIVSSSEENVPIERFVASVWYNGC